MATFAGYLGTTHDTLFLSGQTGFSTEAFVNDDPSGGLDVVVDWIDTPALAGALQAGPGALDFVVGNSFAAIAPVSVGFDAWFEDIHIIPRSFDFGNLLAAQTEAMEVHSAFRKDAITWQTFDNNAGAGVELSGEPSLPATMQPLESYEFDLLVSTSGPPNVDGSIDFGFSGTVGTIVVPVVIERIVLFYPRPEADFFETLGFETDILPVVDGSEQRIGVRLNPRQGFEYPYLVVNDNRDRIYLENLLFEWLDRTFGLPVWRHETVTTQALSAGATTIFVQSTDYRDFRVGGLVGIFTDRKTFDSLEIVSTTSSSITVASATLNDYPIGTEVFPLRIAQLESTFDLDAYLLGELAGTLAFRVTDNDADLADVSAWEAFNSKVFLGGSNLMLGRTSPETYNRELFELDNPAGLVYTLSNWDRSKRTRRQGFGAKGMQEEWELRQLLYALRGRQVSFYSPTNKDDVKPTLDLTSGENTLTVENDGYARYVRARQPRNVIRVLFVDGSTPLLRTVTAAVETDDDVEVLTLDATWPATYTPAEIDRIEFVEEVRSATDLFRIRYGRGRSSFLDMPIVGVFE